MKRMKRVLCFVVAGLGLAGLPLGALAQAAGPELSIGTVVARGEGRFEVPIRYSSHGNPVATLLFSLDLADRVRFDGADRNADGVPDGVRVGLPPVFQPMISFDETDHQGELDVLLTAMRAPLPAMPDGTVLTVTLTAQGASSLAPDAVVFAAKPAPSFGGTGGQSVTGSASDARTKQSPVATSAAGAAPPPVATAGNGAASGSGSSVGTQPGRSSSAPSGPGASSGGANPGPSQGQQASGSAPVAVQTVGSGGQSPSGPATSNATAAIPPASAPMAASGASGLEVNQGAEAAMATTADAPSVAQSANESLGSQPTADPGAVNPPRAGGSDRSGTSATGSPPGTNNGVGTLVAAGVILVALAAFWLRRRGS